MTLSSRAALEALLDAPGLARVNPPLLLDANPYFDLAGEEFGRRLLTTLATDGNEYCLRPEFTLPIVSGYLKSDGAGEPAGFSYLGPVFRQRTKGPAEFEQAGLELLAQPDPEAALDDVLNFARRALAAYNIDKPEIRLGGVGLFEALLAGAEMPEVWRPRIRTRFGHPEALGRLLERLADPHVNGDSTGPRDPETILASVTEAMYAGGFDPAAGRHPEEVAARYREKQALAAARVSPATIQLLTRYLAIAGAAGSALDAVEALAQTANIDLASRLAILRHHLAMLEKAMPGASIVFETQFSPRLDYYTGIVFEMTGPTGAVLASGGQYNRLLQRLGATRPIAAAGCAIWVGRLQAEAAK